MVRFDKGALSSGVEMIEYPPQEVLAHLCGHELFGKSTLGSAFFIFMTCLNLTLSIEFWQLWPAKTLYSAVFGDWGSRPFWQKRVIKSYLLQLGCSADTLGTGYNLYADGPRCWSCRNHEKCRELVFYGLNINPPARPKDIAGGFFVSSSLLNITSCYNKPYITHCYW